MKKFKVYFEIYGKKMVATIQAATESNAKNKVIQKIVFHKVIQEKPANDTDKIMDFLKYLLK